MKRAKLDEQWVAVEGERGVYRHRVSGVYAQQKGQRNGLRIHPGAGRLYVYCCKERLPPTRGPCGEPVTDLAARRCSDHA